MTKQEHLDQAKQEHEEFCEHFNQELKQIWPLIDKLKIFTKKLIDNNEWEAVEAVGKTGTVLFQRVNNCRKALHETRQTYRLHQKYMQGMD